jgi:hypothetical protein
MKLRLFLPGSGNAFFTSRTLEAPAVWRGLVGAAGLDTARAAAQALCSRVRASKNSRSATFPAASAVLSSLKLPSRKRTCNGLPPAIDFPFPPNGKPAAHFSGRDCNRGCGTARGLAGLEISQGAGHQLC